MGDATNPEEIERLNGEEKAKAIIQKNLDLLRIKFIDETPYWELNEETNRDLKAIGGGDISVDGDKRETYLLLRYNTKTGKIEQPPEDFKLGEFSILRTNVVNKGEQIELDREQGAWVTKVRGTNQIRLLQPAGMPMSHEYDAAVIGEEDQLAEEGRKILPERIIPKEPSNIRGLIEPWGESRFVDEAHGDMVMLKTIQRFNELYGPPR